MKLTARKKQRRLAILMRFRRTRQVAACLVCRSRVRRDLIKMAKRRRFFARGQLHASSKLKRRTIFSSIE